MNAIDVVTLGCKVNHTESGQLATLLRSHGVLVNGATTGAPIVVVNTCAVTGAAAAESRKLIRRIARRAPGTQVIVCGCLGALESELLASLVGVEAVTGPDRIPEVTRRVLDFFGIASTLEGAPGDRCAVSDGRARPEIKIQDGCDSQCAYCVVPLARGPSRSVPRNSVINAVSDLAENGFCEVVLTGIHLGRYGLDRAPATNLAETISVVLQTTSIGRIRLSSIEPREISDELLALWRTHGSRLCRHLHVPLQSGSDRVLERMRRPYRADDFRRTIERVWTAIPGVCLGTDIMVGHPGEDSSAFNDTIRLLESLPFSYVHAFPFSPRAGTMSAGMTDRPHGSQVKDRMATLLAFDRRLRHAYAVKNLGTRATVLLERQTPDGLLGTTDNYLPVIIPGSPAVPGQIRAVVNALLETIIERAGEITLTASAE